MRLLFPPRRGGDPIDYTSPPVTCDTGKVRGCCATIQEVVGHAREGAGSGARWRGDNTRQPGEIVLDSGNLLVRVF